MNIGQQYPALTYRVEEPSESDSEDTENLVQNNAIAIINNPANGANSVQHSVVITVSEKFNHVLDLGVDRVASVFTSICRGVSFISLSLLGSRIAENGDQKVKNVLNSFFSNRIVRTVMKVTLVLTVAYLLLRLCLPAIAKEITSLIGSVLASIGTLFATIKPEPGNPDGPTPETKLTPEPKPTNPNVVIINDDKGNTKNTVGDQSKITANSEDKEVCNPYQPWKCRDA